MKKTYKGFHLALIALMFVFVRDVSFAQQSTGSQSGAAQQAPPCTQAESKQFDFWVGEWSLRWGKDGKGANVIQRALNDCVIMESFDGTPAIPLKGMSVSTFNARLNKWQQTWVDNQGGYLDFVGEYRDGRMVLQRKATVGGKEILQRMVWYNITQDKLDWNWERSEDDGKTWKTMWQINYTRKK
jgi:hypothetical protein